jgi:pyruvate/2-oxoglutarate dehydrogenase complex dihydrolipoamide dehydrogenase (E3) component
MIFPDAWLVSRVFPEHLGKALTDHFIARGVTILAKEKPAAFSTESNRFVTFTLSGKKIESDMLVVGIGIAPSIELV